MTHTDRIKQMAQDAGFGIGHSEAAATLFERFAQLVAEDCARVCDERWRSMKSTEAAHYRQTGQPFSPAAFGFNPSDYAGKSFADTIRARYS